jgi:succinoglycan biosynthesis protein ExoW
VTQVSVPFTLAVIIPFYQRTPGVLRRALISVANQSLPDDLNVHVFVIDDGSPAPAGPEITGIDFGPKISLVLIEQENGGVAAARQAGVDKARELAVDYIAFLDSDDTWTPRHLHSAHAALTAGGEFYFSDHSRVGHHVSVFDFMRFPPEGCRPLEKGAFYSIDADRLFSIMLRNFVAHMSTVVYKQSVTGNVRFQRQLKIAGEDRLFVLQILSNCRTALFDRSISVICGEGVNIYYSRLDWSSEGHIAREYAEVSANRNMLVSLPMNSTDRQLIVDRIKKGRRRFAYFALRWLLKGRNPLNREVLGLIRADRTFLVWFPGTLAIVTIARCLNRYRPEAVIAE